MERILPRGNDVRNKRTVWIAWHQELASLVKNFSAILPLVDKAAKANGKYFRKINCILYTLKLTVFN